MSDARQFFPGIHALRAIAATLVVLEHAAYVANDYSAILIIPFSPGRVGVILFFAISGFVIALQRTKPVWVFVAHRFLRIYPTYWLAMALAAVMLTAVGHHVSANTPAAIFLYPSKLSDGSLQIPYWTLAYEMTFYTLAAVAFGLRLSDRALTIIAVLWIIAVNLFAGNPANATEYEFPGASILLSTAVQVFPMGLICGIHFETLKRAGRWPYLFASAIAFAGSTFFPELTVLKILMLGICSCGIIQAVADLDIRSRIVKLLGDASYGIYLMHFPAMIFAAAVIPSLGFVWCFSIGIIAGTTFGALDHAMYGRMVRALRTGSPQPPPAP